MNKPKIMIALPTMGNIHTLLAVVIASWIADAHNHGFMNLSIYATLKVQPVDNARNHLVEEFLKEPTNTHLLFIDADTIPPQDALYRLLAHDLPVVSGITPIIEMTALREPYRKWNAVDQDDKHVEPNTGLIEVKGVGASFILIRREVFEQLDKPYYKFVYEEEDVISEDIYFTSKCIEKGIKTFADTSIICNHEKSFLW